VRFHYRKLTKNPMNDQVLVYEIQSCLPEEIRLVGPQGKWSWSSDGKSIVAYKPGIARHLPVTFVQWLANRDIDLPGSDEFRFIVVNVSHDELVVKDPFFNPPLRLRRVTDSVRPRPGPRCDSPPFCRAAADGNSLAV
jgi:hypothetical protein